MYLPGTTADMADEPEEDSIDGLKLHPEVVSTTKTALHIRWEGSGGPFVTGFRVRYNQITSTYVQDSGPLAASKQNYDISNLVADTYYKICVAMYHNASRSPVASECIEAATSNYGVPVSLGSSLGALLTLCIIVVIVLLARCPSLVKRPRGCRTAAADSSKYDSMSFHGMGADDRGRGDNDTSQGSPQYCRGTRLKGDGAEEEDFSQISEGTLDSLTGSTPKHQSHHHQYQQHNHNQHNHHHIYQQRHQQHKSPMSLAERLYNGGTPRGRGGRAPSLGKCGRAVSLTDGRHQQNQSYRARQGRLTKMHTQFQSIQSEPGPASLQEVPRVRSSDFPASSSSHSSDLVSTRRELTCGPSCPYRVSGSKGSLPHCRDCSPRAYSAKSTPRPANRLETMTSCSEPSVADADCRRTRAPELHKISKTIHLSMEADTMV
ncbi:hypothetical protein PoB_007285500 [Plakobranchus ocellatus]|uniref:Fibronectin type-III domain-containing protein n=1 Tax=Plakobranchus ocellatus TaxID=259542 RepID=A0AAV4DQL7_9GAST|nr:hypothetical protein PoB_007285500 [Plakobranchus ocellatus]